MRPGKTSDCKDATQPSIQIETMIATNAAARFQRRLPSALPAPELVSVRRIRPRKYNPKPVRRMTTEYCWIPRGRLMSQTRARSADNPVSVTAIRLMARDIPESRPISINLFSSECFAHKRQSPGEHPSPLGEFVTSLIAVGDQAHVQKSLQ